jgi:hypothetical protein
MKSMPVFFKSDNSMIDFIILFITGIGVGFINTLAGGGSVIALSLLMFLGLPVNIANGTYRIAALVQSASSVRTFHAGRVLNVKKGFILGAPVVTGALFGALLAVGVDEQLFRKIAAAVLFGILIFILFRPKEWLQRRTGMTGTRAGFVKILVFFALGFYGGFIHIGMGYFLLIAVVLAEGYDLVKANAVKVLIVFMYVPCSLAVFMYKGMVDYRYGVVLAAGQALGAFWAAKTAVEKGSGFIRWVIAAFILATIPHLLGWYDINSIFQVVKDSIQ